MLNCKARPFFVTAAVTTFASVTSRSFSSIQHRTILWYCISHNQFIRCMFWHRTILVYCISHNQFIRWMFQHRTILVHCISRNPRSLFFHFLGCMLQRDTILTYRSSHHILYYTQRSSPSQDCSETNISFILQNHTQSIAVLQMHYSTVPYYSMSNPTYVIDTAWLTLSRSSCLEE